MISIRQFHGLLCLRIRALANSGVEMWAMKYGVKKSWVQILVVEFYAYRCIRHHPEVRLHQPKLAEILDDREITFKTQSTSDHRLSYDPIKECFTKWSTRSKHPNKHNRTICSNLLIYQRHRKSNFNPKIKRDESTLSEKFKPSAYYTLIV